MTVSTRAKSSKFPDPPVLTDGKDPEFDTWALGICCKLTSNSDHFPSADDRITYVIGRCGGQAARHIIARTRPDSLDTYTDAEEILTHLASIYQDINQVINAKAKFRRLMIKTSDQF